MNSKQKGKRGEREWARWLTDRGFGARRGQQYAGDPTAPDVVCDRLPYHFEVKRVEHLNLRDACAQAEGDSGDRPWVVAHRRNDAPWLVTMLAEDWIDLLREYLSPEPKQQPRNES